MKGLRQGYRPSRWLKVVRHADSHGEPCNKRGDGPWPVLRRALTVKPAQKSVSIFVRPTRKQMLSSSRRSPCVLRAAAEVVSGYGAE